MFFPLGLRCIRLNWRDGFHFLWLVKTAYDDHFSFYGDLTSHASCAFVKKPTHLLMVYITFFMLFPLYHKNSCFFCRSIYTLRLQKRHQRFRITPHIWIVLSGSEKPPVVSSEILGNCRRYTGGTRDSRIAMDNDALIPVLPYKADDILGILVGHQIAFCHVPAIYILPRLRSITEAKREDVKYTVLGRTKRRVVVYNVWIGY